MRDLADGPPLYSVEADDEETPRWRVLGPNGIVGAYATQSEAQAKADFLNEQVAQETEDDS